MRRLRLNATPYNKLFANIEISISYTRHSKGDNPERPTALKKCALVVVLSNKHIVDDGATRHSLGINKPMKKALYIFISILWLVGGCTKQDSSRMATIDDVANKRIGVYTGTIYDRFAAERFPSAEVLRYNNPADFTLALKNGKIDVVITNLYQAKVLLQNNPDIGILTDDVLNFPIGIGFNKDNPSLREKFNAFLKTIKADGSYDVMYNRWFSGDPETVKMPQFDPVSNGERRILGVAIGDLPSAGFVNGEYVGFDIEMLKTFVQKENIHLDIISLEFGALIASLKSGKVDAIADCIAITEERQKQVDFSDPYMEDKSAIIALKKNIAGMESSKGTAEHSFIGSVSEGFYNNILHEDRYLIIFSGLKVTIFISIFSVGLGTLFGALVCFMRMSQYKILKQFAKLYISIVRGIPLLVLLMLIYYVAFAKSDISPVLVAVLAFAINFGAYVSEMFRAAIESIDKGQTEAGIAGGFSRSQTFAYIVMPQAARQVLPVYKGELISLVKMTSIVGYIAVQDLTKASDIIRSRTFDAFFPLIMTAVLYFGISWLLLYFLGMVEQSVDPKMQKRGTRKKTLPWTTAAGAVLVLAAVFAFIPSDGPNKYPTGTSANGQITGLSDLDGKRICVITGTTGDFVVREKYKSAQVLDMLYPADGALAVKTHKADAFVFDKCTLQYLAARNENDFELIPEKLANTDIAIPMRLSDKALHQTINSALLRLKNDGTLDNMYKRWFVEQKTEMPQIELDGRNGTLKMGTSSLAEPFAFLSNGRIIGHDIELAYRIAEIAGVKLAISDMSYDAMVTALHAGQIDFAIGNFYKLEERMKAVEFSIPYLQNDISVLIRRPK